MKYVLIGFLCGLMLVAQGCATIVSGGASRPVRVVTDPPGAEVYVNDDLRGKTPLTVSVARRDRHRVRIEHPGYATFNEQIGPGFNPWFLGNILFGGLIGMVIDLASGAHVTPSPGSLKVYLLPPDGDYQDKAQLKAAQDAAQQRAKDARAQAKAGKKANK